MRPETISPRHSLYNASLSRFLDVGSMVFDNFDIKPAAGVSTASTNLHAPTEAAPGRWTVLLRTKSLGALRKAVFDSPTATLPVPPIPVQPQSAPTPRDPTIRFARLLSSAQTKDRGKQRSTTTPSSRASSRPVSLMSTPTGPLRSALRRPSDDSPPRMRGSVSWGDKLRSSTIGPKSEPTSTPSTTSCASTS